ncbi:Anucleate primary sterigmata protein B [Aspergillus nanangensis]|uniref:Anucleate primary sterigmata protein B n=1 Tax=Aspergillus nanangensis TaxID=2582783 RepID=A0AAD4GR75_ASPNN|nr:Anucleate primary sterigmata protein B [Aspergillus nanangensis]
MSTGSAQPPPSSFISPNKNAIDYAQSPRRQPLLSIPSDSDTDDDYLFLEDDFGAPTDFMVEEDARGDISQNTMHTTDTEDAGHYTQQEETTLDTRQDNHSTFTAGHTDLDDSNASLSLPPLPDNDDSSLYLLSSEDGDRDRPGNQTFMEEKEMRRKLMDMESSFLPEPSTVELAATNQTPGADDTYLVGMSNENAPQPHSLPEHTQSSIMLTDDSSHDITSHNDGVAIPQTPSLEPTEDRVLNPDVTSTAPSESYEDRTTMLEAIPSSPSADAAARTINRSSFLVAQGFHESSQVSTGILAPDQVLQASSQTVQNPSRSLSPTQQNSIHDSSGNDLEGASRTSSRRSNRPKYLTSRQSGHRLSYSSVATSNTEATSSDATLGADYALQSGGAAPGYPSNTQAGQLDRMARSVSLGSMASGVSEYSDDSPMDRKNLSSSAADRGGGLQTLEEEGGGGGGGTSLSRPGSSHHHDHQQQQPLHQSTLDDPSEPMTPKAKPRDNTFPTDTVIAERVKDVQVPSTFVKQFREDYGARGISPDKRAGATPAFARSGRTMTLKEQSSTIDRLSKENFDLKMRIHFLNEALNRRSEEGVKEMISENVELKSDKLKLQKDNQTLKRKLRDLEKQLKDQQSDKESMVNHDPEGSDESDRDPAQDEEILFLRERVETYELEIERLRSESMAREGEKRRLAEMVKSFSDGRPSGSDVGAREERDMWKDMLEAETAAREQAEEENKRLRDETLRLRNDMSMAVVPARPGHSRDRVGSMISYSGAPDREFGRHTATGSSSSSTLVMELELLKQENAELRKEVSAQTSMLTSRNREKERLYQEIEELKLGQRREGGRSITGDSIFDRSASRAQGRSSSRASDGIGPSASDDPEREDLEVRNGQLRDQVSSLKLENQAIRTQLDEYVAELETLDKAYQADVDQAEEDIQSLQQERDQALQMADERDAAFQDLRAEAQEELDALGEEFDEKVEECQRLGEELRIQDENLRALQAEMRSASEGIIRLEEDAQSNLQRYQAVQQELEDSNREMESLEKNLYEANTKVQRLTVQIESSQNEIAFLREEQDGDKIRIGDLESELKTYKMILQSEKDKARELEERLADERHQREVVGSKEKQEVQRIVNELNREASAAKEEARKLKKSLSVQEIETNTWRERLMDLENNLRETLGDLSGSRSSLISNIMKLQKTLESTALELESVRSKLDEKESLLQNRDALLESHGLESRKLAELLERERHARRADKQSFEQALKSHHQASRTITQSNSRISELESARSLDRKRFTGLEQQFRDQLNERNTMLLNLWKRLSTMCGPDWAHSNSLINGNLPSQEVIGNMLFWPGFSRNLLLALKTVESVFSSFKSSIKSVERDLMKKYQSLDHGLSARFKRLERLEESMLNLRAQQYSRSQSGLSPEMAKLRGENRLLKAELNLLQPHSRSRGSAVMGTGSPRSSTRNLNAGTAENAETSSLVRQSSMVERPANSHAPRGLARSSTSGIPQPSHISSATTLADGAGAIVPGSRSRHGTEPGGNEKWIQRLHELEKRLKAEREARLLDRSGARKRLEERDAENQRLRAQIERQRVRKGMPAETSTDSRGSHARGQNAGRIQGSDQSSGDGYPYPRDEEPSSSEGEGIYVDIEV